MQPIKPHSDYTYKQEFAVQFTYPVHFTHGAFEINNPHLLSVITAGQTISHPKVLVFVDSGVAALVPQIESFFRACAATVQLVQPPYIIIGGEQAKNDSENWQRVMGVLADCKMDRQNYVIAVGGGSVLDMVGFVASVVHRGIRLIRMPTTVLAQNDAGIGVKNSMNALGAKNFIGTFTPPYAVINDAALLATLHEDDWRGGIAEAIKVALIKDLNFFDFIETHANELKARNLAVMEELVRRCAVLHLEHIRTQGDPFEYGSSRPLDFGHWSAHRLEVMSEYTLRHGQAVAIGIALDSCYALHKQLIVSAELQRVLRCLENCGLPVWHPLLEKKDAQGGYALLQGLEQFREHLGGRLCITLPAPLGRQTEVHAMDYNLIIAAINFLKSELK